jgi:hypothetical protein
LNLRVESPRPVPRGSSEKSPIRVTGTQGWRLRVRTVASALQRLKALGILHWVRRCAESWRDGRFVLEQETNAYAVLPESQWRGYRPPAEPPGPPPGTWGDIHRRCSLPSLESDLAGKVHVLASDPKDGLAAALARLGRAFRSSATTCWQRTCGNFAMTW